MRHEVPHRWTVAGPSSAAAVQLCLGKPAEEVAVLLPRIFNLCRTAQSVAVRLALGLAPEPGWRDALADEIVRDHLLFLTRRLPAALGIAPLDLPMTGRARATPEGVGPALPETAAEFEAWLRRGAGIAGALAVLDHRFAPGWAIAEGLDWPGAGNGGRVIAVENSVAARHIGHPVLDHVAATRGRGPLWRAVARLVDLYAARERRLPVPMRGGDGFVRVPASRGSYAVRAGMSGAMVTGLERVTPTDQALAPQSILEQSLCSLPAAAHDLGGLVLLVVDPCSPVTLTERAQDA